MWNKYFLQFDAIDDIWEQIRVPQAMIIEQGPLLLIVNSTSVSRKAAAQHYIPFLLLTVLHTQAMLQVLQCAATEIIVWTAEHSTALE